tara:strand:+ start:38 stop:1162 length:1125 start_codon:yes stop_codon:yes gene_type:complete
MIRILLTFLLVFTFNLSTSQEAETLDDLARISFFTDVVPNNSIQGSAKSNLIKKLDKILLRESLGSSTNDRFGLVAVPSINTEEKTSGTPPKYFFDMDVNIYAVDYLEKRQFGFFSFEGLKGINANKQRAVIAALREFKPSASFSQFLGETKNKIIQYYNTNCEFILKESETLANNDQFDEAMFTLSSIPNVSTNCFDLGQELLAKIYQQKLERECQGIVSEAKSLIAAESWKEAAGVLQGVLPGISCYEEATALITKIENHWCNVNLGKAQSFRAARNFDEAARALSLVPLSSSCADSATKLSEAIYAEMSQLEQRDWDLKIKMYEDDLQMQRDEMTFELDRQKILSNAQIESAKALSKMKIEVKNYEFLGGR